MSIYFSESRFLVVKINSTFVCLNKACCDTLFQTGSLPMIPRTLPFWLQESYENKNLKFILNIPNFHVSVFFLLLNGLYIYKRRPKYSLDHVQSANVSCWRTFGTFRAFSMSCAYLWNNAFFSTFNMLLWIGGLDKHIILFKFFVIDSLPLNARDFRWKICHFG